MTPDRWAWSAQLGAAVVLLVVLALLLLIGTAAQRRRDDRIRRRRTATAPPRDIATQAIPLPGGGYSMPIGLEPWRINDDDAETEPGAEESDLIDDLHDPYRRRPPAATLPLTITTIRTAQ